MAYNMDINQFNDPESELSLGTASTLSKMRAQRQARLNTDRTPGIYSRLNNMRIATEQSRLSAVQRLTAIAEAKAEAKDKAAADFEMKKYEDSRKDIEFNRLKALNDEIKSKAKENIELNKWALDKANGDPDVAQAILRTFQPSTVQTQKTVQPVHETQQISSTQQPAIQTTTQDPLQVDQAGQEPQAVKAVPEQTKPLTMKDRIKDAWGKKKDQENKPMTEAQSNSATYADRIKEANQVFDDLEKEGFNLAKPSESLKASVLNTIPGGEYLKSEKLKMMEQAKRNFLLAVLRKESGAAISTGEMKEGNKQYFPQPNDTPRVLEQKRKNRETIWKGVQRASGIQPSNENVSTPQEQPQSQEGTVTREQAIAELKRRGKI